MHVVTQNTIINCKSNCTSGCKSLQNTKVLNFAHFTPKNTNISACKNVQIYKIATITVHMHGYYSCANDFFILFFSLPLHLALLLCFLLTTKPQNHPYPSLNHRSLSSSNNKITKPAQPQPQIKVVPPKYKIPKTKISNNPS